jgi:hypothetical protein
MHNNNVKIFKTEFAVSKQKEGMETIVMVNWREN